MTQPLASSAAAATGGVSLDTQRLPSRANLEKAGQQFEAVFIGMMVKSMRSAKLSDGLFDDSASSQFRDMQDQQFAQAMAAHAPIGIGKAMTEFLAKSQQLEAAKPASEGDTP